MKKGQGFDKLSPNSWGSGQVIARLTGTLAETSADHVVIDVNGVGYLVLASGRTLDSIGPAFGQMGTGSAFMTKMRSGGVAVPGVRYVNIMTKYDELVKPYTSGVEAGMTNIVIQNRCKQDYSEHFEIAADKNASVIVLNALDPAHPRPLVCSLVLPFVGGV